MITNANKKIILNAVATELCKNSSSPLPCSIQIKERFNRFFNNETFEFFINHMNMGRYQILKMSNWRQGSPCYKKYIDVQLTDLVDQTTTNGTWNYESRDCENKSYYYPDLNWVIGHYNHLLLDVPIKSNNSSDISKERLIYSVGARPNLNIQLVPPGSNPIPNIPGGGGSTPPVVPDPSMPMSGGSEDLLNFLKNPIVLAGIAVGGYFIWKGSK